MRLWVNFQEADGTWTPFKDFNRDKLEAAKAYALGMGWFFEITQNERVVAKGGSKCIPAR